MNTEEVIEYLKNRDEMIPDKHDGSYELVREAVMAYKDEDLSETDYNDWNLIYFMTVGTFKNRVEIKHKIIDNSHLPDAKKEHLHAVLEKINNNAIKALYENRVDDKPSIGMFGTGFQSFKGKGKHEDFVRFVRMCLNLQNPGLDDEACFAIAEKPLSEPIKGVQAGAASMILHCLRPDVFPIINGQQGIKNIFLRFGLKLKNKGKLTTYIQNCRLIKKYRDDNFKFRNYRIFDCANYEMNKDEDIKDSALELLIKKYKKDFEETDSHEHYKWKAISQFQREWNPDADDFQEMLRKAFSKAGNLLNSRMFFPAAMIIDMAGKEPDTVRKMFNYLFDEDTLLGDRISFFIDSAKEIVSHYAEWDGKNTYQTNNSVSVYLFFMYPHIYGIYKWAKFKNAAKILKYDIDSAGGEESISTYNDMLDWVWTNIKKDEELISMHRSRLKDDDYQDENNHVLAEDIIFFASYQNLDSSEGEAEKKRIGSNVILSGVPGVGKSYTISRQYCDNPNYMERVVFYPDYTHSDFVGQILPRVMDDTLEYVFVPGPFTNCLKKAVKDPENHYYLIIEELNRGNAPAIFGEIFQLLDRKDDDKKYAAHELGESEYCIFDRDIAAAVYGDAEHTVSIPANLTLLATMNTADQNVFTLDTAFQRRWNMKIIKNDVWSAVHASEFIEGDEITWGAFASVVNKKILDVCKGMSGGEDKRLGAYFIKRKEMVKRLFSEKVLKYLWDDVFRMDRYVLFNTDIMSVDDIFNRYLKAEVNPLATVLNPEIYKEMVEFEPDITMGM